MWIFTASEFTGTIDLDSFLIILLEGSLVNYAYPGAITQTCGTQITSFTANSVTINYYYKYHAQSFVTNTGDLTLGFMLIVPTTMRSVAIRNINIIPMSSSSNSGYTNFPCAENYNWDETTSTCSTCFAGCLACSAAGNGNCVGCQSTYYDYGNGTCLTTCSGPFEVVSGTMDCQQRCTTGYYWALEEGCVDNCDAPLVSSTDQNGFPVCNTPCSDSSYYVYPDGSCSVACNSPLTSTTENGAKFCLSPCVSASSGTSTQYLYPDGTCSDTCPNYLSQKTEQSIKYCYSICDSAEYIYPDGSCSGACDSPLSGEVEYTLNFCSSPCDESVYLYPDGSCASDCSAPLLEKIEYSSLLLCYSPCMSPQYVYPNGSCSATCDSPLTGVTSYTISFCISPCDSSSTTIYLYPNSSCYSTCTSPLYSKTEYNILECYNPCLQNNTSLYDNGTCLETCPSPDIKKTEPIGMFCKYPCTNTDYYYNTETGKCTKTCDYPGEAIDSPLPKLCESTLSEEEVKQVKAMAALASSASSATNTGTMIWSVISSSDSTAACMGPLSKMLQYIKWMDIDYPEKVLLMMEEQNEDALEGGYAKKMMEGVLDKFPRHELPGKFELYQTPSSFFVNFWSALFNLLVMSSVTFVVIVLKRITKGWPKVNGVLKALTDILKWNLLLVTFSGNLGDVILFTALEFLSMEFDNSEAILSFLTCLGINAMAIFVIVKILDVNYAIRRSRKQINGNSARAQLQKKRIVQQWSSYKALFDCYKDYSFYQQIFLFVFIVRLMVFNAFIGYFYNFPLLQAITFSLCNISMLIYLVIKRPMKKLVNLAQQIILELVLLPFNSCVLALAFMDYKGIENTDLRKNIGTVIVYINVVVPFLSLGLMAVKAIVIAFEVYQEWKIGKAKNEKKRLKAIRQQAAAADLTEEQRIDTQTPSCENCLSTSSKILNDTNQAFVEVNNEESVNGNNENGLVVVLRNQRISNFFN